MSLLARAVLVVGAVLGAVLLGPGLLSSDRPTPSQSLAPTPTASSTGLGAAEWTGGSSRPHGNLFVPASTRLLRLPKSD